MCPARQQNISISILNKKRLVYGLFGTGTDYSLRTDSRRFFLVRCYSTEEVGINFNVNKIKDIVPDDYVEKFDNLTSAEQQKYNIKSKYKNTAAA